jgi:hypothetical protein
MIGSGDIRKPSNARRIKFFKKRLRERAPSTGSTAPSTIPAGSAERTRLGALASS